MTSVHWQVRSHLDHLREHGGWRCRRGHRDTLQVGSSICDNKYSVCYRLDSPIKNSGRYYLEVMAVQSLCGASFRSIESSSQFIFRSRTYETYDHRNLAVVFKNCRDMCQEENSPFGCHISDVNLTEGGRFG